MRYGPSRTPGCYRQAALVLRWFVGGTVLAHWPLTADQRTVNLLHAATSAPPERGNSVLKTTFKALRRVSLCPWRSGAITAAALVLLHREHGRTT
jgi:hypothetical protein